MTKKSITARLAELRQSDEGRSQVARLRDILPEVEATLASGVSQQAVLDELKAAGFSWSLRGFEMALYRLRKRAGTNPRQVNRNVSASPNPFPASSVSSPVGASHTHGSGDSPSPLAPPQEEDLRGLDRKARGEELDRRYLANANPLIAKVKKGPQA